jgi:hypothetical protein
MTFRNPLTARPLAFAFATILATILASLGIFVLPFCFPPGNIVYAASYVYGFNNSLCQLSVLLSIGLYFLVNRRCHLSNSRQAAGAGAWLHFAFEPQAEGRKETIRPWAVWLCCALTVLCTAYLYVHTSSAATAYYGEATYFTKRILFALKGRSPYTEFDFAYGPALLYLPVWFCRLLASWGVSVKAAYYLFYAAVSSLGFLLLAAIINCLGMPGRQKTIVFMLCALIALNETMGLQYTVFRYLVPLGLLLFIHMKVLPGLSGGGLSGGGLSWFSRQVALSFASIAGFALSLCFSPELGLAYFVALGVYWAWLAWAASATYLMTLFLHAASLFVVLALCRDGYFRGVASFSGGAMNFPVLPAAHILLYLFAVLYTVPMQLCAAIAARGKSSAALCAGWAGLTVATIPGALGRCDFGHTFWYGLPALILTCVGLQKQSKRLYAVFLGVTAVSYLALKIAHFVLCYAGIFMPDAFLALLDRLSTSAASTQADPAVSRGHSAGLPRDLAYADLHRFRPIAAPFGCQGETFEYLLDNDLYQYEYFDGCASVTSPALVDRKLADLKRARTILVDRWMIDSDKAFTGSWETNRTVLSVLFLFPCGFLTERNAAYIPEHEILEFIRAHFEVTHTFQKYYVMRAKGP